MYVVKPETSGNISILTLYDEGEYKGHIKFEQKGYIIDILEFKADDGEGKITPANHYIYDSLIKSCASYAFNHSCFYIYNSNDELRDICSRMRFIDMGDKQQLTLDKIFNQSCGGDTI